MTKKIRAKKRRDTIKYMRQHWQMYILLAIPLIYLVLFKYYPMLGTQIAFKKFRSSLGIWGSEWIGFANFIKFFKSYQLPRVLSNTLIISFYQLVAGWPFPIVLALLLNTLSGKKFKKLVQTTTYLPYFISVVVLVGMMQQILNPTIGIYGKIYFMIAGSPAPDLLGQSSVFRHLYVWSGIWQNMGFNSIIYFAALSSVSPELHEAAIIDGASRFKRVLHIDVPAIVPTMTILLILNAGRIMSVGFEKAFLMQNDLNLRTSEVISTYVFKVGLGYGDFSYGTAIGLFNSVINLALIITVNRICKKMGETSLW